jgi:hypothetical protein
MSNEFNDKNIGVGHSEFSSADVIIPKSIKFGKVSRVIAARRVPVKVRAENPSYSSDKNKLIRIPLPSGCIYDTRGGYLTFNASIAKTGGTYARFHSGIFTMFNRMRVLAGSSEVEDMRDYNRIYTILFELFSPILSTGNVGVTSMGFGTQLQRNALSAGADYACPLFSGVFGTELLPFDNIPNQIWLELYIEDPTVCVETDGTIPIITITNIVFHIERLELQDDYRRFISNYVRANGLTLGFHTWERFSQTLPVGSNHNLQIASKNASVNGMINLFLNAATINDTTVNDRFLTWTRLNLTSTSLQLNGRIYPDEPIDTVTCSSWESYQILLRWLQKWNLNGIIPVAPSINSQAFAVDRFLQIDDFEPFPELDDVINPYNTLSNNTNIIKKYTFSVPTPANYQLDTWVQYFKKINIAPNGDVSVVQ